MVGNVIFARYGSMKTVNTYTRGDREHKNIALNVIHIESRRRIMHTAQKTKLNRSAIRRGRSV